MSKYTCRLIFSCSLQLRRLCSAAAKEAVETAASAGVAATTPSPSENRLSRRISAVLATGGKVADVLHQYISEGNVVRKEDLMNCLRSLRKYKRYQHCLEILEWMENGRIKYPAKSYATRLDIISKLKGIAEAEKYFGSLSPDAKNKYTCEALLRCYCMENMVEKAAALFEEMKRLNFRSRLVFNNLMTLFMKVGRPDKVPPLIQDMAECNLPPSSYAYTILIQSYACMNDLEGVDRVLEEILNDDKNTNWTVYHNLAMVYVRAGVFEKAELALNRLEEFLKDSIHCERSSYHLLIIMYANTGNVAAVKRVWISLKSSFPRCHNLSYLHLLEALSRLDDVDGLAKYFEEWNNSHKIYNSRLANIMIGAYLSHDMLCNAEQVFEDAVTKAAAPYFRGHEMFMAYFLDKGEIRSVLKHVEAAVAKVGKDEKWQPDPEIIGPIFGLFKEEKDVDGAEEFCRMLKKVNCLDLKAVLSLLQIYIAAGRTATGMRARVEEYGVEDSSELESLLEKVCPK
ncbi:hypothetical protein Nepgr_022756 [Nepenthes gracilis]|uniref:Pentatricopeptide repeat-containing protein n=1 Tax=Nepenthes gracilis TaxID=150966 RepID=A0AAD3T1L3_NEPGR|nr:hypothetical protein Nepgr_022756 [Nepenthes gracilis]